MHAIDAIFFCPFDRECYFSSDSVHRKMDFTQTVNHSSAEGGLTCSFVDSAVTMFFQFKKRQQQTLTKKFAVPFVGRHAVGDGEVPLWVLN